jgi:copper resistance protein B
MKRLLILLAASSLAAPAAAQHNGHHPPGHAGPAPKAKPGNPQAGHDMGETPTQAPDPHEGHDMQRPVPAHDPHAGHVMTSPPVPPPVAPPPPEAFDGPAHAAETVYDTNLFRRKRQEKLIDEHGGFETWMFLADQLEYRINDGRDGYKWDIQGWYGGDYDKLWLKSEGEGAFGEAVEQLELQALYSRSIDPWWNFQAGIRHDFRPDPERTHLVVGIQGLAPYWFELDGQLFLSDKGDLTGRAEAEYDQRITNKLILQPAVELNFSLQDVPEIGIGAGLSSAEAGLRLRYEVVPEFAPYVGIEYEHAFGDTADFRRDAGDDVGGWALLTGIRLWF